jgi:hypothetical protein
MSFDTLQAPNPRRARARAKDPDLIIDNVIL